MPTHTSGKRSIAYSVYEELYTFNCEFKMSRDILFLQTLIKNVEQAKASWEIPQFNWKIQVKLEEEGWYAY